MRGIRRIEEEKWRREKERARQVIEMIGENLEKNYKQQQEQKRKKLQDLQSELNLVQQNQRQKDDQIGLLMQQVDGYANQLKESKRNERKEFQKTIELLSEELDMVRNNTYKNTRKMEEIEKAKVEAKKKNITR